jgi:hypothetical protein
MELDAPPPPPPPPPRPGGGGGGGPPPPPPPPAPMAGVGAVGTSHAAADSVLDDIAIVEAAVAVGAVAAAEGGSPAPLPADACC